MTELVEKLKKKNTEEILEILNVLLEENDFIESATDGLHFVNTLKFVATKGETGQIESDYLQKIIENRLSIESDMST